MEIAWRNSVRAILILGLAILGAGILGMAAIFHNQHNASARGQSPGG